MSRRTTAPVREVLPDPVYGSVIVEKFICRMMVNKGISSKTVGNILLVRNNTINSLRPL